MFLENLVYANFVLIKPNQLHKVKLHQVAIRILLPKIKLDELVIPDKDKKIKGNY